MDLQLFLYLVVVLVVSATFHELAHGLCAYYLGDPTAKQNDRLSLNPLKHLDLLGSLVFLLTQTIGWAKPVPVDARYFKSPKLGMAATALAGPLTNFVLAFFSALPLKLFGAGLPEWLDFFLLMMIRVNLVLGIFNLFPLPPLDGSKVMGFFVPAKYEAKYYEFLMNGQKYFIAIILIDVLVLRRLFGFSVFGSVMSFLLDGAYLLLALGT